MMISGFTSHTADVNGQTIVYARAGSGPALLLLHGFPQTHAMWHEIAPDLAKDFTVITADLRGYGASSTPKGTHNYSFREMAADQLALMQSLGFETFHLVGHDRGGRTAHRLTLDYPKAVKTLTVLDIVPTHTLLSDLSHEVAKAYYHWFFLSQPSPMPEAMILADPDTYYESCLLGWGAGVLSEFSPDALEAYRQSWRRPHTIRAMCDDYRAAIEFDFDLDAADLHRQVACPALVLFGAQGKMAECYDVAGTWAPRLADMQAKAIPGGHFFPDTNPRDTIDALRAFLSRV
ncbi:MAG: alpha/beta hydrolase [Aliishimia sp.]